MNMQFYKFCWIIAFSQKYNFIYRHYWHGIKINMMLIIDFLILRKFKLYILIVVGCRRTSNKNLFSLASLALDLMWRIYVVYILVYFMFASKNYTNYKFKFSCWIIIDTLNIPYNNLSHAHFVQNLKQS